MLQHGALDQRLVRTIPPANPQLTGAPMVPGQRALRTVNLELGVRPSSDRCLACREGSWGVVRHAEEDGRVVLEFDSYVLGWSVPHRFEGQHLSRRLPALRNQRGE